jgi:hypothetical protein
MEVYNALRDKVSSNAADLAALHAALLQEHRDLSLYVARRDADRIFKACKGLGTDDKAVIGIVCHRTREQIGLIDAAFRALSGNKDRKSLAQTLDSECSGDYGRFLKALATPADLLQAGELKSAFDGLGCNTKIVNELFTTMSNAQIQAMRQAYERHYDSNLVDRLKSELSGEHEKLILRILTSGRGVAPVNVAQVAAELSETIKKGSSMMGGLSDKAEQKVIELLVSVPPSQTQDLKVISYVLYRHYFVTK